MYVKTDLDIQPGPVFGLYKIQKKTVLQFILAIDLKNVVQLIHIYPKLLLVSLHQESQ